jgi:hypothetical protein
VSALKKEPGRWNTISVLPLVRAEAQAEGMVSCCLGHFGQFFDADFQAGICKRRKQ